MATFSDNFDRAGGALGSDWSSPVYAPVISSNLATGGATSGKKYSALVNTGAAEFSPDQEASVHWNSSTNTFTRMGVVLRGSTLSGNYRGYRCIAYGDGNIFAIQTFDDTVDIYAHIATLNAAAPIANGDVIRARVVGNQITMFLNDVEILTVSDTTYATGQPGIYIRRWSTSNGKLNDFSASDISNGGVEVSYDADTLLPITSTLSLDADTLLPITSTLSLDADTLLDCMSITGHSIDVDTLLPITSTLTLDADTLLPITSTLTLDADTLLPITSALTLDADCLLDCISITGYSIDVDCLLLVENRLRVYTDISMRVTNILNLDVDTELSIDIVFPDTILTVRPIDMSFSVGHVDNNLNVPPINMSYHVR